VPEEIPINIKRPLDVFMKGLPVVSVCCVVRIDMDGCGATDFMSFRNGYERFGGWFGFG
jgi:hypothetical protein